MIDERNRPVPIDDHLDHLRALAAAASVQPLDLAAHEAALVREAEAEMAARQRADPPGIDWERIRRMAQRHRR
jgi:hypothetical protein